MRIAIAGKGGTGKTTIAGTLARVLGGTGRPVLAVDADSNPNLASIVGLERAQAEGLQGLGRDLVETVEDPDGTRRTVLTRPVATVVEEYGVVGPDGVRIVLMGKVDHGGVGCMCRGHAAVRGLTGELVREPWEEREVVVLDMEAGLEHLSRGTGRYVDAIVAVLEPYYRALETGARIVELAKELEIRHVFGVPNKIRDEQDRSAVAEFCEGRDIALLAEVPFDPTLMEAERAGRAPLDFDPDAPAVAQIRRVARELEDRLEAGTAASP